MTNSTYNGWTNWETWNVGVWLDNDEPMYRDRIRFIRSTRNLDAKAVEQYVREVFPFGTPDMNRRAELKNVNWEELAEAWADEVEEYAE